MLLLPLLDRYNNTYVCMYVCVCYNMYVCTFLHVYDGLIISWLWPWQILLCKCQDGTQW